MPFTYLLSPLKIFEKQSHQVAHRRLRHQLGILLPQPSKYKDDRYFQSEAWDIHEGMRVTTYSVTMTQLYRTDCNSVIIQTEYDGKLWNCSAIGERYSEMTESVLSSLAVKCID